MSLFSFARRHIRVVIGLLNAAVIIAGILFAGARAGDVGPRAPSFAASLQDEAKSIEALRAQPAAGQSPAPKHSSRRPRAPAPAPAEAHGAKELPIAGKGMWIWLFNQVEGGDPVRIVRRARSLGLTHLYVRSSSTTSGLKFLKDIDRIVPVAHAAGIKVIAWDFPTLRDPYADARRMTYVIDHRTPGGDRVDGMAVDLETGGEGVSLTTVRARRLALSLKKARPDAFRILVPPRPTKATKRFYPYGIIPAFDAVAPMVYWHHRDAGVLARQAVTYLKRWGKPVAPIGQAYDPALDPGGIAGAPTGRTLVWFAQNALDAGAVGVSFWSWQHASPDMFRGIARIKFPERPAAP